MGINSYFLAVRRTKKKNPKYIFHESKCQCNKYRLNVFDLFDKLTKKEDNHTKETLDCKTLLQHFCHVYSTHIFLIGRCQEERL